MQLYSAYQEKKNLTLVCSDREVCENREEETPGKSTQECARKMAKGLKMSVRSVRTEKHCQRGVRLTSTQIPAKTPNISSFQEKRLDRAKKMFAEIECAS